ncbi:hypothetical protein M0813_00443 [Anaeramoeba flamelloides]|uniref:Uncharacterized protein n=1 Tax=Anaeramoeba flamelloides TaxID=1746091 RepID=A0ABQ8YAZ3_9EUKA|nr:hypothetical protein M0813_00443 [Anaeramoeba flamelloides]
MSDPLKRKSVLSFLRRIFSHPQLTMDEFVRKGLIYLSVFSQMLTPKEFLWIKKTTNIQKQERSHLLQWFETLQFSYHLKEKYSIDFDLLESKEKLTNFLLNSIFQILSEEEEVFRQATKNTIREIWISQEKDHNFLRTITQNECAIEKKIETSKFIFNNFQNNRQQNLLALSIQLLRKQKELESREKKLNKRELRLNKQTNQQKIKKKQKKLLMKLKKIEYKIFLKNKLLEQKKQFRRQLKNTPKSKSRKHKRRNEKKKKLGKGMSDVLIHKNTNQSKNNYLETFSDFVDNILSDTPSSTRKKSKEQINSPYKKKQDDNISAFEKILNSNEKNNNTKIGMNVKSDHGSDRDNASGCSSGNDRCNNSDTDKNNNQLDIQNKKKRKKIRVISLLGSDLENNDLSEFEIGIEKNRINKEHPNKKKENIFKKKEQDFLPDINLYIDDKKIKSRIDPLQEVGHSKLLNNSTQKLILTPTSYQDNTSIQSLEKIFKLNNKNGTNKYGNGNGNGKGNENGNLNKNNKDMEKKIEKEKAYENKINNKSKNRLKRYHTVTRSTTKLLGQSPQKKKNQKNISQQDLLLILGENNHGGNPILNSLIENETKLEIKLPKENQNIQDYGKEQGKDMWKRKESKKGKKRKEKGKMINEEKLQQKENVKTMNEKSEIHSKTNFRINSNSNSESKSSLKLTFNKAYNLRTNHKSISDLGLNFNQKIGEKSTNGNRNKTESRNKKDKYKKNRNENYKKNKNENRNKKEKDNKNKKNENNNNNHNNENNNKNESNSKNKNNPKIKNKTKNSIFLQKFKNSAFNRKKKQQKIEKMAFLDLTYKSIELVDPSSNSIHKSIIGVSGLIQQYLNLDRNPSILESLLLINTHDKWETLDLSELNKKERMVIVQNGQTFSKAFEDAEYYARMGSFSFKCLLDESGKDIFHKGKISFSKKYLNIKKCISDKKKITVLKTRWGDHLKIFVETTGLLKCYLADSLNALYLGIKLKTAQLRRILILILLLYNSSNGLNPIIGNNPPVNKLDYNLIPKNISLQFNLYPKRLNSKLTNYKLEFKKLKNNKKRPQNYKINFDQIISEYWEKGGINFLVYLLIKKKVPILQSFLKIRKKGIIIGYEKNDTFEIKFSQNFQFIKDQNNDKSFKITNNDFLFNNNSNKIKKLKKFLPDSNELIILSKSKKDRKLILKTINFFNKKCNLSNQMNILKKHKNNKKKNDKEKIARFPNFENNKKNIIGNGYDDYSNGGGGDDDYSNDDDNDDNDDDDNDDDDDDDDDDRNSDGDGDTIEKMTSFFPGRNHRDFLWDLAFNNKAEKTLQKKQNNFIQIDPKKKIKQKIIKKNDKKIIKKKKKTEISLILEELENDLSFYDDNKSSNKLLNNYKYSSKELKRIKRISISSTNDKFYHTGLENQNPTKVTKIYEDLNLSFDSDLSYSSSENDFTEY